jgi:hypothetical protein
MFKVVNNCPKTPKKTSFLVTVVCPSNPVIIDISVDIESWSTQLPRRSKSSEQFTSNSRNLKPNSPICFKKVIKQDWKSFQSLPANLILVYCIFSSEHEVLNWTYREIPTNLTRQLIWMTSSSGLRGHRRTYLTILKRAWSADSKMVRQVLLWPLRPELDGIQK